MRKKLCIVLMAVLGMAKAQVPNNGFETLNSFNNTSNWGMIQLLVISIDSSGVYHGDSIVYDNPGNLLYFPTTDAYQGSYALEMRNAFNYTTNQQIVGRAALSLFPEDYSGFGGTLVPVTVQPTDLNFYYKYFPVNNDTAWASLTVYDSLGVEIGNAVAEIVDPAGVYTLLSVPVHYISPDPAAYISMEFRAAKAGTAASFGTRFQVDEVNLQTVGLKDIGMEKSIRCYPVPVDDKLHLEFDPSARISSIQITDAQGRLVLTKEVTYSYTADVDISSICPGLYFVQAQDQNGFLITKFIKR